MKIWTTWGVFTLILVTGCGAQSARESRPAVKAAVPMETAMPAGAFPQSPATSPAAGEELPPVRTATEVPKGIPRKIIYTADIELIADNFDQVAKEITTLIAKYGGYLAETDVQGSPGENRTGRWKARVPVEAFDSFVESVVALGELQRRQSNSQDVTEEFYDLEARVKNKKVEEQRLVEHLKESTGKLKDILDVEKEISRVREEIERIEGRLRLLANLTSLTTVTIVVHERRDYVPPQAPAFKTRIAQRFQASLDQLVDFAKELILAAVSVVPWLPVWAVVIAALWLVVRWLRRFRTRTIGQQGA